MQQYNNSHTQFVKIVPQIKFKKNIIELAIFGGLAVLTCWSLSMKLLCIECS